MSVSKFQFQKLINLLRRSENDPEVRKFFGRQMALIERDEYYGSLEFRPEGVDAVFQEAPWVVPSEKITDPKELYLAAFHFHRTGHEGYRGYSGELPNGVALDDLESDVLRKMGRPTTTGGGTMSKVVKGVVPRWFKYAYGNAFLHFQLDPNGRVALVTLQTPDI